MAARRTKRGIDIAPPLDPNAGIPKRKKRKKVVIKRKRATKPAKKTAKKPATKPATKPRKKTNNVNFIVQDLTENTVVPKRYAAKPKAAQKKDNQVYYDRHFFEVLRNQTIRRMTNGYRIMYPTLQKYDIIQQYLKIAPPEYVAKFKNEEIYFKRQQKQQTPFVNETAVRVANALRANSIGTSFVPTDIKIVINAGDTPGAAAVNFNANHSFGNDFGVDIDGEFPQPAEVLPPVNERDKVYTYNQAKSWFMGSKYLIKKGNQFVSPAMDTRTGNVRGIQKLMRILDCINGDKKTSRGLREPRGDENIIECFSGTREEIEAKVEKIRTAPNKKTNLPPANGNKNIIGTIQALARDSTKHSSPFRQILGEEVLNEWTNAFTRVMNKFRNKEKKKRDTKSLVAIDWKKLIDVQKDLKKQFHKLKKDKKALPVDVIDANMDYVLWSLYTLQPPRRDDYGWCRILKPDQTLTNILGNGRVLNGERKDENGVITQSAERYKDTAYPKKGILNYYSLKQKTFLFQLYKTATKYGQRMFKLNELINPLGNGKELAKVLKESYNYYPRTWIFEKVKLNRRTNKLQGTVRKKLSQDIIRIAKHYNITNPSGKLGVNMFRHSYITHLYEEKKINMNQKFQLAALMLHNQTTAESTYLYVLDKNKTIDEIVEENDEADIGIAL